MSVALLGLVDITEMRDWITAIPFDEWDQSAPGRPAMMTDQNWHGFYYRWSNIVFQLQEAHYLPESFDTMQHMLSVVMPYQWITPHRDGPPYSNWLYRVHVPLTSNDLAWFVSGREVYQMVPGYAYKVDMTVEHAVTNGGDQPRIHYMFDVLAA